MLSPFVYTAPIKKILNNKVFRNFSYLTIGTLLSQLLSLITILRVTHLINPTDYGIFTFLIAQGTLLHVIGNVGSSSIVIRTVSRDNEKANNLVYNGLLIRLIALTAACSIYILYNHYFGTLTAIQLLYVFAFSLVNVFANLTENIYHGNQKMFTPTLISLIYSFSWFVVVYSIPQKTVNVSELFFLYLLLNALKSIFYFTFLKTQNLLCGEIKKFPSASKELLTESWPYFFSVLVMLPVTSLSSNFLDINSNVNEIGFFNLSQRLIGPVFLVLSIVFTALFPNLSALWTKDREKFKNIISIGFSYFMLCALLLCFLFNLFAKEIVSVLFPSSYQQALAVCKMQIWYIFLTSIDSLIGTILGATNNEKQIFRFGILYFLLCTPIFFYGSKFGALGLAWGYVISFSIGMFYVWNIFKRTLGIKIKNSAILWNAGILLFLLSCLIPPEFSILSKVLLASFILSIAGLYSYKTYL